MYPPREINYGTFYFGKLTIKEVDNKKQSKKTEEKSLLLIH